MRRCCEYSGKIINTNINIDELITRPQSHCIYASLDNC